ncbi:MAG: glycosyltransferase family 2 protein [Terriglobia bacterium]
MMQELQVSAIVPARNEEANIAAAVESLAAQTVPVEIIVVNDASTDRTGAILEELRQRRAGRGRTTPWPAGSRRRRPRGCC